uniref:Uncharacterized protein n=1 Tax=Plectus sambesii TaxID=2011161 RepID=A0A914V6X3_9BILA
MARWHNGKLITIQVTVFAVNLPCAANNFQSIPTARDERSFFFKSRLVGVNGSIAPGAFGPMFRFRDRPDMVPVVNNLHTKWYIGAVDALVSAYAKSTLKHATKYSQLSHARCVRTANEIPDKAHCLLKEIKRQEHEKKLKQSLNEFRRTHRRVRMKRGAGYRKAMGYKSGAGHDFVNVYKNGFLTGGQRKLNRQDSASVQSPLQALSTLIINSYRENSGQRDKFSATLSKLNTLQNLFSNSLPANKSSAVPDNHRDSTKPSFIQEIVTQSPTSVAFPLPNTASTADRTFFPKVHPIKMKRLYSLGEASPLSSLLSLTNALTANQKFEEVFSPRFAPILRKKSKAQNRLLSPTVMSFYRDSAADNIASIPEMMDTVGVPAKDQEALLEMMLEVSGASKTINKIFNAVNQSKTPSESVDLSQQVEEAVERIESVWADVYRSFSFQQHSDFEKDGYTFLRRDQLERLYGSNGLYRDSATINLDLDDYEKWTDKDRDEFLKRAIEKLASKKIRPKYQRIKGLRDRMKLEETEKELNREQVPKAEKKEQLKQLQVRKTKA